MCLYNGTSDPSLIGMLWTLNKNVHLAMINLTNNIRFGSSVFIAVVMGNMDN